MAHAEIAYTMAAYLFKKVRGDPANGSLSIHNFEYHEPFVARKTAGQKQLLHTEAILRPGSNRVMFRWYNVETEHWYASAAVAFEDSDAWMADWSRSTHLITSRIEYLQEAAKIGRASKLNQRLTYRLFANLVDWSEVYKGKQSVFLEKMEACAEVQLSTEGNGSWYIPPWHLESLVTLSGFVLNSGHVTDVKNNFFVTPGYKSLRFARPLKPGGHYQSYVKMMPTDEPGLYAGDAYILEAGTIVGVSEKIMYRSWPRIMLQRFFVPPKEKAPAPKSKVGTRNAASKAPITNSNAAHSINGNASVPCGDETHGSSTKIMANGAHTLPAINGSGPVANGYDHELAQENWVSLSPAKKASSKAAAAPVEANPAPLSKKNDLATKALDIIADAASLDVEDLEAEACFADLGVDSLMSLVLAQKFRSEMGVEVRDSIFVEFPCVGDLCRWLEKC